jgi:hypothetical protein
MDRPNYIGLLRLTGTEDRYSPDPLRHVCGFPALRLLWGLRRLLGSLGDCTPPPMGLPRSHRWTLRSRIGGGYRTTHPALRGIPTGGRVYSGNLPHPLGWYLVETSLGSPTGLSRCLVSARAHLPAMQIITGQGDHFP